MTNLSETIATRVVPCGHLALYWLCQAGFAFKTDRGKVVLIDPYLTDVVERLVGFKRLMSCPITADEVSADLVICTHEHLDHMDSDALPTLAQNERIHFAGPIECMKEFEKHRISPGRCHLLEEGKSLSIQGVEIHAVYADHGELAPDALGVVVDFSGIRVYHTGDTALRVKEFGIALEMKPHILLPCINGAFGNMNADEAATLTKLARPDVVIPTHFGMFAEHNGDPGRFLELCSRLVPQTKTMLLKPGEEFIFQKPA